VALSAHLIEPFRRVRLLSKCAVLCLLVGVQGAGVWARQGYASGRNIKGPNDLANDIRRSADSRWRVAGRLVTLSGETGARRWLLNASASWHKLPEIWARWKWRRRPTRVGHEASEMYGAVLDIGRVRSTRHPFSSLLYIPPPYPPSTDNPIVSCSASSSRAGHVLLHLTTSPLLSVGLAAIFIFFSLLPHPFYTTDMFTHAPRLVHQRPAAPAVYERTPSYVPPLVPRSRAPSLRQSPPALPFPTRQTQSTVPPPAPAARPSPEPWVDALKDDVEAEFSLSLVDDVKAAKDTALAAATTVEARAAILREYDESMADIRAQARAEFQRRVEAERERRLQGNYHGKDALIAEQHSIMDSIVRENMHRDVAQLSTAQTPSQAPSQSQLQPSSSLARPSQPIPIPVQRNRSRNGGPSTSHAARSVSNTPYASSSSSPSPRPFPTVRRDSITQHPSARLLPPPVDSPATSVSSMSSLPDPSSSRGSSYSNNADMNLRYEEHRVAVQWREEEVKKKEAAARRSAEEARRREEAAARHEEDARRKNEEATRRMREAELREQQVRVLEARARKGMELAQKGPEPARVRPLSQAQSAAVPPITRVWNQKPRTTAGAMMAPNREARVRA
jgi:hypothetical protein